METIAPNASGEVAADKPHRGSKRPRIAVSAKNLRDGVVTDSFWATMDQFAQTYNDMDRLMTSQRGRFDQIHKIAKKYANRRVTPTPIITAPVLPEVVEQVAEVLPVLPPTVTVEKAVATVAVEKVPSHDAAPRPTVSLKGLSAYGKMSRGRIMKDTTTLAQAEQIAARWDAYLMRGKTIISEDASLTACTNALSDEIAQAVEFKRATAELINSTELLEQEPTYSQPVSSTKIPSKALKLAMNLQTK